MDAQPDPRTRLYEIAEQQAGYFTASQALEAGYSHASQHYHQKAGNWRREGHGIYRLERFPHSADEHYVRLMLWSRDRAGNIQAAASHETALQAYDLSDVMPAKIHLTIPKGFRNQPPAGVRLHQGHHPDHVADADVVVHTMAVPHDHPELKAHPTFEYEDGILAGLVSAHIALRAELKRDLPPSAG